MIGIETSEQARFMLKDRTVLDARRREQVIPGQRLAALGWRRAGRREVCYHRAGCSAFIVYAGRRSSTRSGYEE